MKPVIYNPTHIANSSATLIDHVYTNDFQNNVKCYILPHDLSDHLPVLFTTNNKALIASPLRPQVRDARNFIAEDFLINLQQNFNKKQINFSQIKNINQQFIAFINIFQNSMNMHAPFRTLIRKEVKLRKKTEITPALLKSIKTRNKLYSLKMRNSFDESIATKFKVYKKKTGTCKRTGKKIIL